MAFETLHPRFCAVADYLAAKAPPGRLPGRQHVDPAELKPHLPFINLIDVAWVAGVAQFRYRLWGTAQVQAVGYDGTGRTSDETHSPADAAVINQGMLTAVLTRRPDFAARWVLQTGRGHVYYQRVHFPLARDGESVDMLLTVYAYPPAPPSDDR